MAGREWQDADGGSWTVTCRTPESAQDAPSGRLAQGTVICFRKTATNEIRLATNRSIRGGEVAELADPELQALLNSTRATRR